MGRTERRYGDLSKVESSKSNVGRRKPLSYFRLSTLDFRRSPFPRSPPMKLITCIIRPDRLPEVKLALFRAGVTGITLTRVSGHGGESEVIQRYRADAVVLELHEKVKTEMAC